MTIDTLFLLSILACIVLAAIGAKLSSAEPWKGAVLGGIYVVVTLAIGTFQISVFLIFIAGVISIAISAGPMALKNRQTANILLGCLIGYWTPIFIMPSVVAV